ncbi:MAG: class I SAM-dependent methyltransferase [Burkholderiales bacterium]|nr:class I SAM-dependent methyltransferase [Burkholderiales bacterium]MDR4517011.1 class I SAM-dependent methyltransferase [Nitrosomonas sp.]
MDYRESHKARGASYDKTLEEEAISNYMTRIEAGLLRKIVPVLFPETPPKYLDFACGTGRITSIVAAMSTHSFGVDISESMLEKAKLKCPDTQFFHMDITKDSLNLEPLDLITSFRFFGNAQDALRADVLLALNKLLKKDGYLLINNHRNPWSLKYMLGRLTGGKKKLDLSPVKLKKLLNDNGFKITKVYGIGAWIFRNSLAQTKYLNSKFAKSLEAISRFPGTYLISPDSLIVAKKYK